MSREVCCLAERRGDYVKLFPKPGEPQQPDPLGTPHLLELKQEDFKGLISKAKFKAHSGLLEGHGSLLAVRCITRAWHKHHSRVPILIDAKAILGAAAKGRSSATALRALLRSIAAHTLGVDLLLRLVYVPSEHNPSDGASRGKRRRDLHRVRQRTGKSRLGTHFGRKMMRMIAAYQCLRETDMLSSSSNTSGESPSLDESSD